MSCPPITLNPGTVPVGLAGTAYTSTTFSATGGTAPYQYTVIAGTLPAGLTLTTAGVLSGTPTTSNGAGVSITVQARDAFNCLGTRAYTIKICPVISLAAISTTATTGIAYSSAATATGGASPYVYAVSSGTLNAGLSLNTATGAITGTPTSSASQTFTISATDANACTGTRSYTLAPVCPTITVTPATLPNAAISTAYSQTLSAAGGTSPYTWTVSAGTLPAGLTLSTAGVISGTPTAANGAGTSVTFRAQDANGCAGTLAINVRVCPVITPAALNTTLTLGSAYSSSAAATGGVAPYVYALTSGTLPAGLSLDTSTGAVTGTPTSTTSQTFTIRATDANTCIGTRNYTLAPVCPAITVNPASLAVGTVGTAYSQTLTATGGTGAYTFSLSSGTLPAGLTLTASTGVIAGTPTASNGAGVSLTFTATDSLGCTGVRTVTLKVCPVVTLSDLGSSAVVGRAFSQTVAASGGATAYTFAITSGSLPTGLSLNTSTGVISGTPTTAGTSAFTLSATDANGCPGSKAYSIQTHATLLEWNTEDSTSGGTVSLPSFVHGCIFNTNGLNHSDNGTILATANSVLNGIAMTGARARSTTGWDNTDTLTLPRPNDGFNDRVLTSTFAFENLLTLNWGNFSMDVRRPATNSPTKYRAALIWFQGSYPYSSGITPPASAVRTAWTNTFTVTTTNTWTTMNLPFTNFSSGITALPAFNEVANEKMVLIVQAWDGASGGTVGALEYDNVVLGGAATCSAALSLGDTVFADLNGNSIYEPATDSGIGSLAVELLTAAGTSFVPPVTTTTNVSGVYSFTGLPAGSYKVKVTPGTSYPLAVTAVNADNGVNNDSNGIQAAQGAPAISPAITLANGTEPGSTGTGNAETTIDFGFKTCPPITLSPTTLGSATVGTAYSQTISGSGGVGPYTFSVTSGTLPAGLTLNTSSGAITATPSSARSRILSELSRNR